MSESQRSPGCSTTSAESADARLNVLSVGEVAGGQLVGAEVVPVAGAKTRHLILPAASRDRAACPLAGIVRSRETAINTQRVSVLAELWLVSALANRDRRLRARANELRTRLAALAQLRQTPGGGMTLLRPGRTPSEPIAPRIARDVIVAIALGILGWATFASVRRSASIRRRRVQAAA